ncbi:MAG: hypothetical protein A3A73_00470 [Omnitrophica bacterium RIFCSPLOWO2_01_FULL_50_24]|nr:MAG: hypothetical protein A3A73_00470 [Omnitrophica bacterium RIFCSPLOWO2_01_FULL_50_24]
MNGETKLPTAGISLGAVLLFITVHFCFSLDLKFAGGIIMALPALVVTFLSPRKASVYLLSYIALCFAVSNRTIYIGEVYRIYPQEVLLVALFAFLLMSRQGAGEKPLVSWSGKCVVILTLIGIITAAKHEQPMDLALFYAKGVLLFVPVFYSVRRVVTNERTLQIVCLALVAAALVGSFMSIADYHGLDIAKVIFGETEKEVLSELRMEQEFIFEHPFYRAGGTHAFPPFMASSVYLIFFLSAYLYHVSNNRRFHVFLRIAQLVFLIFIFYSGYRSIWIALMLSLALYAFHRGAKTILGLALAGLLVTSILPQSAIDRFGQLYGESQDTSVKKRIFRTETAVQSIQRSPLLGRGWGASGLIHNDFLQFGADAGIGTLITFLFFYGGVLYRLYWRYWYAMRRGRGRESHCMLIFFAALTGYAFIWISGSHFNVQETFITFWLVLALGAKVAFLSFEEKVGNQAEIRAGAPSA